MEANAWCSTDVIMRANGDLRSRIGLLQIEDLFEMLDA